MKDVKRIELATMARDRDVVHDARCTSLATLVEILLKLRLGTHALFVDTFLAHTCGD